MTIHLVIFSDSQMSRSAILCRDSAFLHGVDRWWYYIPENLSKWTLAQDHPEVFRQPEDPRRAWAWWAWKPWIVSLVLEQLKGDDVLIYSDAGVEFINNVSHIISRMDQDIFLFGNNWEHAHWCKSDVIHMVWPGFIHNVDWSRFGKQVQASVIFFRVSDYTRSFVAEWLKWCLFEGGRLIDDSPSRLPNHPEFREHRHDQAILTTLAYREGCRLHYWPAMYNDGAFTYEKLPEYAGDDYPTLFHHHRRRNSDYQ